MHLHIHTCTKQCCRAAPHIAALYACRYANSRAALLVPFTCCCCVQSSWCIQESSFAFTHCCRALCFASRCSRLSCCCWPTWRAVRFKASNKRHLSTCALFTNATVQALPTGAVFWAIANAVSIPVFRNYWKTIILHNLLLKWRWQDQTVEMVLHIPEFSFSFFFYNETNVQSTPMLKRFGWVVGARLFLNYYYCTWHILLNAFQFVEQAVRM